MMNLFKTRIFREVKRYVAGLLLVLAVAAGVLSGRVAEYPSRLIPRSEDENTFRLSATEVTVDQFNRYCEATGREPMAGHPRDPVTGIDISEAEAYCEWLGKESGQTVRLPTAGEWERASRGGIFGAPFPWGWGSWSNRCVFDASGPARVASYPPNAFGLFDMAGNVAEWCRGDDGEPMIMGGSWAEDAPSMLRVDLRVFMNATYRDRDVGFRVLMEEPREVDQELARLPRPPS